MSGHSKWHSIKHKKAASDAKKGKVFTKLARAITVAARGNPDPDTNFQLRLAIDQAKAANMPKDNIERAIARATGEGKDALEEVIYEAYGPGGVAIIIEVLTDNKNRTVSNLKHILSSHGGSLAGSGSVAYLFERKGMVRLKDLGDNPEEMELKLIDAGAEDIYDEEGQKVIVCQPNKLKNISKALEGVEVEYSGLEWTAKDRVTPDEETQGKLEKLFEALEEDDDVNDYSSNLA
jgi:YebC/PmpR family DNA-binding regulatory protein